MELTYIKGNLLKDAPSDAYLVQACNCQGVWGSGIAAEFKKIYPEDFKEYVKWCHRPMTHALGTAFITSNRVTCLFTSNYYGKAVSDPDDILVDTWSALQDLERLLPAAAVVYSNKFNSGLFNVPWEHTEYFLKCFLKRRSDIKWTVVEYE